MSGMGTTRILLGACALCVSPLTAVAADPAALDRVEVSGQHQGLRVDVQRTCPTMAVSLDDRLARKVAEIGRDADYQVRFELRDGVISGVETRGGPMEYRRAVRSAVRYSECQDSQASAGKTQRFAFFLAIRPGAEPGAAPTVAMRELDQRTLAQSD
ncbi:hypothetical protein [Inhella proteolytica]|uniref:Uncharacterized protein n=1 Tax=Inhella proteolytica TaxID=2795029 RepID=A0A931J4I5_9BURK|nr:hypothetical protein [Inhella proteolytica]MBH9578080.1 hypothetical protein [Inhella proteolytica]